MNIDLTVWPKRLILEGETILSPKVIECPDYGSYVSAVIDYIYEADRQVYECFNNSWIYDDSIVTREDYINHYFGLPSNLVESIYSYIEENGGSPTHATADFHKRAKRIDADLEEGARGRRLRDEFNPVFDALRSWCHTAEDSADISDEFVHTLTNLCLRHSKQSYGLLFEVHEMVGYQLTLDFGDDDDV